MARETTFEPNCVKPRPPDKLPLGQHEPLLHGYSHTAIDSRRLIASKLPVNTLVKMRRISKEWMTTINNELSTRVKTLFLFDDQHSVGQYLDFLWLSNLDSVPEYVIGEEHQVWPAMVLFVKDIKVLINNERSIIRRLSSVTMLAPIARPALIDSSKQATLKETGNGIRKLYGESWHQHVPELLEIFSNVDTLILQHWGYFNTFVEFKDKPNLYKRLKLLHLIQPSRHSMQNAHNTPFFDVKEGAVHDGAPFIGGTTCVKSDEIGGKVKVFHHKMADWNPRHKPNVFNPDHDIEEFPDNRHILRLHGM